MISSVLSLLLHCAFILAVVGSENNIFWTSQWRRIHRSLFSRWENSSTPTGGRSERICYLACLLLLLETSHVWGGWISFKLQCFTWNVGAWRVGVGKVCLWEAGLFYSFWFYGGVVVSHGTWAMLVKEIFCDCSHVSWCLKVSRCFTWNTTFLQQPMCFTWNAGWGG